MCELSHLGRIGGSSLTDTGMEVEEPDLERREIPSSYVPFRNAHFLSIATSWGEVLGARSIFIGPSSRTARDTRTAAPSTIGPSTA